MTVQISIIGLGQIGASIGMALAKQEELLRRTGHDKDFEVARKAEKMGALDKVEINLPNAIRGADLILLCLPLDQIRETLALAAMNMKEGAVIMDTSPVKETVSAWAAELLPQGRHYVGLTPVINAAYLHDVESGVEAAHADLFRGGLMAIVTPPRAGSEAIKLAADLTRLLGASPLFADPLEVDSMMAATHLLPQLLAAGLVNATLDQPGWREGRKLAGRAYAEVTAPIAQLNAPHTLATSLALNRENMLRMLDSTLAALQSLRTDLENEDIPALEEKLTRARGGRDKWWQQRQEGDFSNGDVLPSFDEPTASDVFSRLLGLRKPKPKK